MEENSEIQIETDVSASSGNVSETQQMSGSHGDVEMVIVVEKVKEEAEGSSDNKLPEFKISDSESYQCSKDSSKKDIPTQKCVSSPNDEAQIKDISHENNTQKTVASPCKDTVITEEKQTDQLQKSISSPNKDLNQKKQTSKTITSDKKETQIIDVSKANPPEKIINKELNQKILVEKKSTPVCKDIQIIDISLKNQNQKIVVSPSKSIQIIDVKGQTSKIIISPTKDVNQKNKTQKLVISPIKDAKTQEHQIEKNDRISNNPPITTLNIQNATETIEHKKTDSNSEEKPAVEIDSSTSITPQTDLNLTPTQEAVVDAETNNDKPENPNINDDKKEEIIFNTSIDVCEKSNDSQTNSDITEKEHNKSISRELKSLIKSAKESKIISECTQLTSKTRKSRIILDSSNISLNSSVEADKIQGIRRSSNNSQKSNCSEKSEKAPKRSMRSQNPEFVNKVKQFLNSVTGKFQKGESDDEIDENKKETHSGSMSPSPKKKKLEVPQPEMSPGQNKLRSDSYCWRCHWAVEQSNEKGHSPMQCTVCPRSFHYKCLSGNERSKIISDKSWVCPECLAVLHAESSETRSPAMKKISLGLLCELLQHALERMMDLNGVEPFINPVDRLAFPDYDKYVVHPMDLTLMKNNIAEGLYGSTEAFLADAQWILHNSIIFNTLQSKLTGGARALVRSCRAEMGEIEACPECYAAAHARRPTWFTDVCSTPHVLLWAKLKGFPYWPAKGMSVSSAGLVDVRFFGAHDRAWVPARDCFLYCEKDPNNFRTKRQDILDSMQEAEQHIRNISRKYGKFLYPPFKTPFDPTKLTEQLKMMIPTFEGELRSPVKEKSNSSPNPAKEKRRSNSKSSKGSVNEGDISETDEPQATTSRKMADGAEIAREEGEDDYCIEKDKSMEIDVCLPKEKETSRKRRRSDLEEAVITIIESSNSEKRKKVDIDKIDDKLDPVSSNKTEKNQVDLTKTEEDKTIETPTDKVEVMLSLSKNNVKESTTSTIEKESPAEKTPAKINIKIKPTRTCTPREKDEKQLTPKQRPVRSEKSTPVEKEKQETKAQKRRNSKNKSFNNSQTGKIEREKAAEKKNDKDNSNSKDKSKDIIITRVKGNEADKSSEKPNKSNVTSDSSKSTKESSHFDDNTTLAVIAREGSKTTIPGLPTISSVRSLSTTQNSDSNNKAATNNKNTETVTANSDSSIFIPTSTDNVRNMKEAVNKLQKLRNEAEPPLVGRVGVRAFARMTSPTEKQTNNKPTESVEVEIKSEPIDFDDADRQSEKLDLMNSFHLRPVNPPSSGLRGVRINKVVVAPIARKSTASKPAEARVKAKKTFPQPKKVDDGRSELNSKNSMVYIPIQPPSTQAPVRPTRPITLNGTANTQAIRPQVSTVTSNVNSIVNTVTTPLIPLTSSHSNLISTSTVAANTTNTICVPTVGQIPTTVHTVPLITSVNGQWTFSLQPVMSVGGLDGTASPPVVNGLADRNNSGTVTPLATASASQPAPTLNASTQSTQPTQPSVSTTTNESTPGEPPRLQQRPPLLNPLDSNTPIGSVPPPSTAGPLTAKLNQNAVKLADFFRNLLEDSLEKVDEPTSQATILKLQLEQMQWRYQQEIKELKHNHDLTVTEMRASFEKEKSRAISEARRTAQVELETAVKAAKSKQWCANCSQEALFYCCWNTSYCDYPCQRAHWSQHYAVCTQQKNQENNGNDSGNLLEKRLQPAPDNLPALQKSSQTPALTVGGKLAHTRVYAQDTQSQKTSIIVSMVEDQSGNQTVKCLGTYKPTGAQVSPLIINKQIMNNEENASKKVVTSGGYLIVGAGSGNQPLVTPSRRTHTIQYYT